MRNKIRFYLGTVIERRQFLFTELGTFRSVEHAKTYWLSKPRNSHAYVFQHEDLYRLGVNYGTRCEIIATVKAPSDDSDQQPYENSEARPQQG